MGRLAAVTVVALDGAQLATPLVTSYFYDLADDLVATHEANGTAEYRTYDALNRLLAVEDVSASGISVTATCGAGRSRPNQRIIRPGMFRRTTAIVRSGRSARTMRVRRRYPPEPRSGSSCGRGYRHGWGG